MKTFPVMLNLTAVERRELERLGLVERCPLRVPWAFLEPHEAQARANHDQSLSTLAERGGLDPTEMIAVLEHRPWRRMSLDAAIPLLEQKLAAFKEDRVAALEAKLDKLRGDLTAMHRRAQEAEGIVAKSGIVEARPQGAEGRSLGRALANYGAAISLRERDEARETAQRCHEIGWLAIVCRDDLLETVMRQSRDHAALVEAVRTYLEADARVDEFRDGDDLESKSRIYFAMLLKGDAGKALLAALPPPTAEEVTAWGEAFEDAAVSDCCPHPRGRHTLESFPPKCDVDGCACPGWWVTVAELAASLEEERRAGAGPHCPVLSALHFASAAQAIAEMNPRHVPNVDENANRYVTTREPKK